MTQEEAKTVLELLFSAYPYANRDIGEQTIRLYITFLNFIPYQIGQAAALKIISNNKFFPTIAELKEAVKDFDPMDNKTLTAEEAWEEVRKNLDPYRAPKWSSPIIERAVRTIGYRNLCDSTNPGIDMAQFMRIYEVYRKREQNQVENESILEITQDVIKKLPGGFAT